MAANQHGLSRNIPKAVAREVRRRCGFGCVVCGLAIYTYEHFDPPFADARAHEAKGITLLCSTHQLESAKGLLSKVQIAGADRHPRSKQVGYADYVFNLGGVAPLLRLGRSNFENCGNHISYIDKPLLRVTYPEMRSPLWRISADFGSICQIVDNELRITNETADFEQVANRFLVRGHEGQVLLSMSVEPPKLLHIHSALLPTPNGNVEINQQGIYFNNEEGRPTGLEGLNYRGFRGGLIFNEDGSIAFAP